MGINVLSCFDGISAGQLALQRAEIVVDNYYSSEIDTYAIKITQKNFPNTIQLGDINGWKDWNLPKIDLIIGGSPCQGFSHAGAGLNFDDPRSKLFFTFVDILNYYKPKYFLLENVKMKKEWADVISKYLNVEPILINSSLVSAQNRNRYYWTNISNIKQPENKFIYLKDIIEDIKVDKEKYCEDIPIVIKNIYPSGGQNGNVYSVYAKSPVLSAGVGIIGKGIGSSNAPKITEDNNIWKRLTVKECERLQTFTDNYTEGVSNTQRYKCLGNSWTVDVITHIFKNIKE